MEIALCLKDFHLNTYNYVEVIFHTNNIFDLIWLIWLASEDAQKNHCSCNRRPPVPRPWERPPQYPPTQNDYVRYNTDHVEESAGYHEMRHEPRLVDGKDGHVIYLNNSGLVPQYVAKAVCYIFL